MGRSLAVVGIAIVASLASACLSAPDTAAPSAIAARPSAARDPNAPCGDGDHVSLAVWLSDLRDDDTLGALAGATVTFDVCPGYSVTTDELGMATARVPRGVPIVTTLSAPGHVTSVVSQSTLDDDGQLADFLPTLHMAGALPGWSSDSAILAVYIEPIGSGACADVRGVSLGVVDHPEAHVYYMRPAWPFDPSPGGTSASLGEAVIFTGLPEGDVRLEGTKAGCTIKATLSPSQTGLFRLRRGAFTVGNVFVDD